MAVALLCFASSAWADTVSVTLTGVSGVVPAGFGFYGGVYYLTVGSTTGVSAICDDYTTDININYNWNATVNTLATLSATKFYANSGAPTGAQLYYDAAWLVHNEFAACAASEASCGDYSAALYGPLWIPKTLKICLTRPN
jgi:hypothetical protein